MPAHIKIYKKKKTQTDYLKKKTKKKKKETLGTVATVPIE